MLDLDRDSVQILLAGPAHRAFNFRGDVLSFVFINFDNDFVVNDVHDFG